MITIGYVLAGLIAAAIIVIGARFILAPRVAADDYGVATDAQQPSVRAYLSVKGVRDIASGLFVIIVMVTGSTQLLGWMILAATIIPVTDAIIVLRSGGPKGVAYGVHGGTAAVMLITTALLFLA